MWDERETLCGHVCIGKSLLRTMLRARLLIAVVSGREAFPQLVPILKTRLRRGEGLGQLLPERTRKNIPLKESDGVPQNNRVGSSRADLSIKTTTLKRGMGRIHYFRTPGAGWTLLFQRLGSVLGHRSMIVTTRPSAYGNAVPAVAW